MGLFCARASSRWRCSSFSMTAAFDSRSVIFPRATKTGARDASSPNAVRRVHDSATVLTPSGIDDSHRHMLLLLNVPSKIPGDGGKVLLRFQELTRPSHPYRHHLGHSPPHVFFYHKQANSLVEGVWQILSRSCCFVHFEFHIGLPRSYLQMSPTKTSSSVIGGEEAALPAKELPVSRTVN